MDSEISFGFHSFLFNVADSECFFLTSNLALCLSIMTASICYMPWSLLRQLTMRPGHCGERFWLRWRSTTRERSPISTWLTWWAPLTKSYSSPKTNWRLTSLTSAVCWSCCALLGAWMTASARPTQSRKPTSWRKSLLYHPGLGRVSSQMWPTWQRCLWIGSAFLGSQVLCLRQPPISSLWISPCHWGRTASFVCSVPLQTLRYGILYTYITYVKSITVSASVSPDHNLCYLTPLWSKTGLTIT